MTHDEDENAMTEEATPLPETQWPERLTLRDTKVFADEGQRIYTTATGYGYEKLDYVRADLANGLTDEAFETADRAMNVEWVAPVAVKAIGYMRDKDSDGTSFWVSKTQNAYYGKPVYDSALVAVPAPVAEPAPVAWQWRYRTAGDTEWNDWNDGRAPDWPSEHYLETDERPLFASPPKPNNAVVGALREALELIDSARALRHADMWNAKAKNLEAQAADIIQTALSVEKESQPIGPNYWPDELRKAAGRFKALAAASQSEEEGK